MCNCVKYITIPRIKVLGAATCVMLASLTFLLWTSFKGPVGRCWVQAQPVPGTLLPHQGPHPGLVLTTTKAPQLSACRDNAAGPGGAEISLGGEKEKMDSHRRWRKRPCWSCPQPSRYSRFPHTPHRAGKEEQAQLVLRYQLSTKATVSRSPPSPTPGLPEPSRRWLLPQSPNPGPDPRSQPARMG